MKKSTLTTIQILLLAVSLSFVSCSNFNFLIGKNKIRYNPKDYSDAKFDEIISQNRKNNSQALIDHKFNIKVANSPDKMQGILYETWYDGVPYFSCGGSGNSKSSNIPSSHNHRILIHDYQQADSTGRFNPMISIRDYNSFGIMVGCGRVHEMVMPSDGVFKKLDVVATSNEEDAIIPILAYFTPQRFKDESMMIDPNEYDAIEDLPMQEFIDSYVKKYDGFIVYARNYEFDCFFTPIHDIPSHEG